MESYALLCKFQTIHSTSGSIHLHRECHVSNQFKAWRDAVTHDATFLVLNCGRYERIGIRHRGSQTLYLSGIIDTLNAEDPHYRKLHVGLYVAIIQDALIRQEIKTATGSRTQLSGQKRSAAHLDSDESNGRVIKRAKRSAGKSDDYTYVRYILKPSPLLVTLIQITTDKRANLKKKVGIGGAQIRHLLLSGSVIIFPSCRRGAIHPEAPSKS